MTCQTAALETALLAGFAKIMAYKKQKHP